MIGLPSSIITLGLGGSPSLMLTLGYGISSATQVTISTVQPYITVYFWKRVS